jgi:predicted permease
MFMPVGPSFFGAMQIPILRGREFEESDMQATAAVAVANESFAKSYFANESPIGRQITVRSRPAYTAQIIGLAKDARYSSVKTEFHPILYILYNQESFPPLARVTYELRTAGDPLNQVNTVRKIVHQADPALSVSNARTQSEQIDQSLNQEITLAGLCAMFAALGLLIASIGLYGAMSHNVAKRTREIGIRIALGADHSRVFWLFLRDAFVVAALGLTLGLTAAFATSRLIGSLLFEVKPADPLVFMGAAAIILGAVVLAGCIPALRASRVDAITALQHE